MLPVLERYIRAYISCDVALYNLRNTEQILETITENREIVSKLHKAQEAISVLQAAIQPKIQRCRKEIDKKPSLSFATTKKLNKVIKNI